MRTEPMLEVLNENEVSGMSEDKDYDELKRIFRVEHSEDNKVKKLEISSVIEEQRD